MKNLCIFLVLSLFISPIKAQFTKSQANDLVLNQILTDDLTFSDVYVLKTSRSNENPITLVPGEQINIPYANSWVYFVDDNPFAHWAHKSRLLFVDTATGNHTITSHEFFPTDWKENYDTLSAVKRLLKPNITNPLPPKSLEIVGLPKNPHLYAVIICGSENMYAFWNDVAALYVMLTKKYGYMEENIFIHYTDGYLDDYTHNDLDNDDTDERIYTAEKEVIHHTFNELANITNESAEIPALQADDQLFVYVTDHGSCDPWPPHHSYISLEKLDSSLEYEYLYDYELANWTKDILCSQMIFLMQQCRPGGFTKELLDYNNYAVKCNNRTIHTAAGFNEPSYYERFITNYLYSEFTYYWIAAAFGFYPEIAIPGYPEHETGNFPFTTFEGLEDHPGDFNPDLNGDGFVQMNEAFYYADYMDTNSPNGYSNPVIYDTDTIGGDDEHKEIVTCFENPINGRNTGFKSDIATLYGLTGIIDSCENFNEGNYAIGNNLILKASNVLQLNTNVNFHFMIDSINLTIQDNAYLNLMPNTHFYGNPENHVIIDGDFFVGNNTSFSNSSNSSYFGGLLLNALNKEVSIKNASFNFSGLKSRCKKLSIENTTFNNAKEISTERGDVSFISCNFIKTGLNLQHKKPSPNKTFSTQIKNSTFNNQSLTTNQPSIMIDNYEKFHISDNVINGSNSSGIFLTDAGHGLAGNQNICNNIIHNCSHSGISVYNSIANIGGNNIYNNKFGIWLGDNSSTSIYGNPGAVTSEETQLIQDNENFELYAANGSFPWYFRYNVLLDEDNIGNPSDPILYYDYSSTNTNTKVDGRYNCWGSNFNPLDDLYPSNNNVIPLIQPQWCPNDIDTANLNGVIKLYKEARENFEENNFTTAESKFKSIIEDYPQTAYAEDAIKSLFALKKTVNMDFEQLQTYLSTTDSIQHYEKLKKLADFISNKCNVELRNYPEAINFYENIIANPETLNDSIFAVIDLGYTYEIMASENNNKSTYVGKMSHLKPDSHEAYIKNRAYLLSLIPKINTPSQQENNPLYNNVSNLLHYPNPSKEIITISYRLLTNATVHITIYSVTGESLKTFNPVFQQKGLQQETINISHLPSGIYFYSLTVNGKETTCKKLVITK